MSEKFYIDFIKFMQLKYSQKIQENFEKFKLILKILIVKALAEIPVTVPSNAFPQGLWGQSLPPVFLFTLCVFVTDCTYVLTLSFSRLHEHVVRQLIYSNTGLIPFDQGLATCKKYIRSILYSYDMYSYILYLYCQYTAHTHTQYIYIYIYDRRSVRRKTMKMLMSTWDKW